jgi:hypothetical protein
MLGKCSTTDLYSSQFKPFSFLSVPLPLLSCVHHNQSRKFHVNQDSLGNRLYRMCMCVYIACACVESERDRETERLRFILGTGLQTQVDSGANSAVLAIRLNTQGRVMFI